LVHPKVAGSNPARGQFFAMLISCSRSSDGYMRVLFWQPLSCESIYTHTFQVLVDFSGNPSNTLTTRSSVIWWKNGIEVSLTS